MQLLLLLYENSSGRATTYIRAVILSRVLDFSQRKYTAFLYLSRYSTYQFVGRHTDFQFLSTYLVQNMLVCNYTNFQYRLCDKML